MNPITKVWNGASLRLKALAYNLTYTLFDKAFGRALSGNTSYTGKSVTETTAMQISAVWGCVRLISQTMGATPWAVYEDDGNGTSVKVPDHDLMAVLTSPNGDMTDLEMKEAMSTNLELQGNGYAVIERRKDKSILTLTPIPTAYCRPKIDDATGQLSYVLTDRGKEIPYPADLIWPVRGFGSNGITGLSPIAYARESMGLSLATEEFQGRFFGQGATPSWVVSIPNWLTKDQRNIARENIEKLVAGLQNAHRAWLLEGGMTATPATMPLADAEFLGLRGFSIAEICRWFGVPPHMVADLQESTNNNIEHQSLEFLMYCMRSRFKRFELSANKRLLKPEDRIKYKVRFDLGDILLMDAAGRAELNASGLQNGYMTRNEVRRREGLNRSDAAGMDGFTVQVNMVPLDKLGDVVDANIKKNSQPKPAVAATAPNVDVVPPAKSVEINVSSVEHKVVEGATDALRAVASTQEAVLEAVGHSSAAQLVLTEQVMDTRELSKSNARATAEMARALADLSVSVKEAQAGNERVLSELRKPVYRKIVKKEDGEPLGVVTVDSLEDITNS